MYIYTVERQRYLYNVKVLNTEKKNVITTDK